VIDQSDAPEAESRSKRRESTTSESR
jgi:hypothetical protein